MGELKIICIDCFDTIIFRRKHPFSILKRWASSMEKLYPNLAKVDLLELRMDAQKHNAHIDEILRDIFDSVKNILGDVPYDVFRNDAHNLELGIEAATHYANKKIIKEIKKFRNKEYKVVCVSDFHLTKDDLHYFFERLGVASLIDDIYVSSEYGVTKAQGLLYRRVLDNTKVAPSSIMMIGDNRKADICNAKKYGLRTKWIPNFSKKKYWQLERNRKQKLPKEELFEDAKRIRKTSVAYAEYSVVFWAFSKRLYHELKSKKIGGVVFLSREGFFLKKCFDQYQSFCVPASERVKTDYFKCSRRAIYSVQLEKRKPEMYSSISIRNYFRAIGFNDCEIDSIDFGELDIESQIDNFASSSQWKKISGNDKLMQAIKNRATENEAAFASYVKQVFTEDMEAIVDIGWLGRMQHGIEDTLGRPLHGYYLGIYGNTEDEKQSERKGLIFQALPNEKESRHYHILRSNIILYELLSAAPHGSAQNYRFVGEKVVVSEQWDTKEKNLYDDIIADTQEKLFDGLTALCVDGLESIKEEDLTDVLANVVLHTALLPKNSECTVMKRFNLGFSQNFGEQKSGLKFEVTSKFSVKDIFTNPVEYVRYFSKLPLILRGKIGLAYYPIMFPLYLYVKIKQH